MKLQNSLILICIILFSPITVSTGFAKLNIVTTTEDIAAIAKEVAGDLAEVQSIAKGGQDPHFIQVFLEYGLDWFSRQRTRDELQSLVRGREPSIAAAGRSDTCLRCVMRK